MAEKTFALSGYANLDIIGNAMNVIHSINITKRAFGKDPITAVLSLEEWKQLALILPSVKESAQKIWGEIQAGTTPSLNQSQRILSDKYVLILNVYAAPNGNRYVMTGLRQYFYGSEGQMLPKKDDGVTLSFKELCNLATHAGEVDKYISLCLSNSRVFALRNITDMFEAQRYVEEFWKNSSGRCRILLEKPNATTN